MYDKYCVLHDSTLIGGITDQDLLTNTEMTHEVASGRVWSDFVAITAQKPTGTYTSRRVGQLLTLLDADSLLLPTSVLAMYAQKHAAGGTRETDALHRKYTMNSVLAAPQTLRCAHGEDATMQVAVTVGYDGTHDPIVIGENQSLPAATLDDSRYTLGPMTVGGVLLDKKTDFALDFGHTVTAESSDSDIWPTFLSVDRTLPMIKLTGLNPRWLADSGAIPLAGKAAQHLDTTLYLRKRAAGGTFVPNATAQHIRLTVAGLIYIEDVFRAADRGETSLTIPLVFDGTNAPLKVTVGVAIP